MSEKLATLTELEADLLKAVADLELADEREKEAARNATRLRNRVNDLQKLIDAKLVGLRSSAPWNTEWANSKRQGSAV